MAVKVLSCDEILVKTGIIPQSLVDILPIAHETKPRRLCQAMLEKSAIPCRPILEQMEERVSAQPELQTEVGLYKKEPADRRHCDHVQ